MKRILSLCCGGGGACKGYADAGFYPVGVDINPLKSLSQAVPPAYTEFLGRKIKDFV